MRRALAILAVLLLVLAGVVVGRASWLPAGQVEVSPAPRAELDEAALAERLAASLRIANESLQDPEERDDAAFAAFHALLEQAFPLVHAHLARERVGDWSLLYTWQGSDSALRPLVLLAHQDVVPVEPGTEEDWEHPPYAGVIADGFVWGRGALDDKLNVMGQLEAVADLLAAGVRPRRTVLLAFGHDEEIGGHEGARRIAALLEERGVEPLLVLDEGGAIVEGLVPGVEAPLAAVGIAEKGYVTLELTARGGSGHSSTPPAETSIGLLAGALARLEREPLPTRLDGASRRMLEEGAAPESGYPHRLVYANLWLFAPLVERVLSGMSTANAMVRTTTAPTMLEAGVKENVLPSEATAVLNFRILPGDSVASVVEHVERVVDDPRITVEVRPNHREPSRTSRTDGEGWELLSRSLRETQPGVVVTPYLMLAGSDARHYEILGPVVYRHMPLLLAGSDTQRIHGTNERVSVEGYADLVRTYRRLLENGIR